MRYIPRDPVLQTVRSLHAEDKPLARSECVSGKTESEKNKPL
jgi:hypothetical protein